eukprot:3628123-Amphidinium_carterae.1
MELLHLVWPTQQRLQRPTAAGASVDTKSENGAIEQLPPTFGVHMDVDRQEGGEERSAKHEKSGEGKDGGTLAIAEHFDSVSFRRALLQDIGAMFRALRASRSLYRVGCADPKNKWCMHTSRYTACQ